MFCSAPSFIVTVMLFGGRAALIIGVGRCRGRGRTARGERAPPATGTSLLCFGFKALR